jgi:hypothetical protein
MTKVLDAIILDKESLSAIPRLQIEVLKNEEC